jgi:hypothetical protein
VFTRRVTGGKKSGVEIFSKLWLGESMVVCFLRIVNRLFDEPEG